MLGLPSRDVTVLLLPTCASQSLPLSHPAPSPAPVLKKSLYHFLQYWSGGDDSFSFFSSGKLSTCPSILSDTCRVAQSTLQVLAFPRFDYFVPVPPGCTVSIEKTPGSLMGALFNKCCQSGRPGTFGLKLANSKVSW